MWWESNMVVKRFGRGESTLKCIGFTTSFIVVIQPEIELRRKDVQNKKASAILSQGSRCPPQSMELKAKRAPNDRPARLVDFARHGSLGSQTDYKVRVCRCMSTLPYRCPAIQNALPRRKHSRVGQPLWQALQTISRCDQQTP